MKTCTAISESQTLPLTKQTTDMSWKKPEEKTPWKKLKKYRKGFPIQTNTDCRKIVDRTGQATKTV